MNLIRIVLLVVVFDQLLLIGNASAQKIDYQKVEHEYLTKARNNIEKFRKGDAQIRFVNPQGKPIKNLKIEVNQTSQDFLFGALLFDLAGFGSKKPNPNEQEFKTLFLDVFNYGILPFYWSGYEPQPGKPEWQKLESSIEWATQNKITLKGHPLAWTHIAGTPEWLSKYPLNVTQDLLKARIYTNVAGFRDKIKIWDVVNEPVTTLPWEEAMKDTVRTESDRYQVSKVSMEQITPWVEQTYRWAYEANPKGHFILNEFNQIAVPKVRQKFFDLVQELQKRKTPLGGLGLQAHEPHDMWFSPIELYATLDQYAALNLPIHITEFIPQSSGKDIIGWREGKWTEQAQGDFAEQFYTLAFGHPTVVSINWWAFSDKNTWLKGGGLVNEKYEPKPAYQKLKQLIKTDWMTRKVEKISDTKGQVRFRGFYGEYEATVTQTDGSKKSFFFHLSENKEHNWVFTL